MIRTKSGCVKTTPLVAVGGVGAREVSPAGIPLLTQSTNNCFSRVVNDLDCARCGCPSPAGQGGMWLLCTANFTPIPCFLTWWYEDNGNGAIPPLPWQLPQWECTMQAISFSQVELVWACIEDRLLKKATTKKSEARPTPVSDKDELSPKRSIEF